MLFLYVGNTVDNGFKRMHADSDWIEGIEAGFIANAFSTFRF